MQNYIKIQSQGIIDPQAFVLIGASTKRQDNSKIGFFGSGLKYSIAYLLRNEIEFKVFADYNEIKFHSEEVNFRDTTFKQIFVNGVQTSMTTEMGMDWESWFILREIYCNALDEGESSISIVDECLPVEDKTAFYIKVDEDFKEIIDNWDKYFSEKRNDLIYSDAEFNQIYNGGEQLIVYRKGIRCFYAEKQKCIFNYDLDAIKINESRVIKDDFDFKWNLRGYLQKIKDKKVISQILNTINDKWEKYLSWDSQANYFSDEWLIVLNKKTLVPSENAGFWQEIISKEPEDYIILPGNLVKGLKDRFLTLVRVIGDVEGGKGMGEFLEIKELTNKQTYLLNESIKFLKECKYDIDYPVKIVNFVSPMQLGLAKDDTIFISVKLFDRGKKEIVATLLEESEHLKTGLSDETRAFQNHLFNKWISALEDNSGIYL